MEGLWELPADAAPSLGDGDAQRPRAALGAGGAALLSWIEVGGPEPRLLLYEEGPEGGAGERGWSRIEPAAALEGASGWPHVAADAEGRALLAFQQTPASGDGAIYVAERDPSGAWRLPASAEEKLSFDAHAYEPRVELTERGRALLIFNQWRSNGFGVSFAERAAGEPWRRAASAEDSLTFATFHSNAPRLAVGPEEELLVAWYQSPGASLEVYAAEREAGGAWRRPGASDGLSLAETPVDSHGEGNPMPAIGPSGEAAIAWTQEDGEGGVAVYVAEREAGGPWRSPADLRDARSALGGRATCVQIAFGPGGHLYLTWYQGEGEALSVRLAHRDPRRGWDPPATISAPGRRAITPVLAFRGAELVVAYAELHEEGWTVQARAGLEGEGLGPAERLSPPGEPARAPAIAGRGADLVVAWLQGPRVLWARRRSAR